MLLLLIAGQRPSARVALDHRAIQFHLVVQLFQATGPASTISIKYLCTSPYTLHFAVAQLTPLLSVCMRTDCMIAPNGQTKKA
jgi:hypothetical protein